MAKQEESRVVYICDYCWEELLWTGRTLPGGWKQLPDSTLVCGDCIKGGQFNNRDKNKS